MGPAHCFNLDGDPRAWDWIPNTGQAPYDDVGWLGAIFIAIAHAGCDRHTKG